MKAEQMVYLELRPEVTGAFFACKMIQDTDCRFKYLYKGSFPIPELR